MLSMLYGAFVCIWGLQMGTLEWPEAQLIIMNYTTNIGIEGLFGVYIAIFGFKNRFSVRSLTPSQAARNALTIAVHNP